jgi:hypothetical protein
LGDEEQLKKNSPLKRAKIVARLLIWFILMNLILILYDYPCEANLDRFNHYGIAVYGGPGSMTPLVDIARVRKLEIENNYMIGMAFSQTLWTNTETVTWEIEESAVKYLENLDLFSLSAAVALRWLKTPWGSQAGKTRSSFAFGNGLSYANGVPELESRLPKTSSLLYHLFLEVTFSLDKESPWEAFFRIHHRSGAFGLFNGVVGGSDFLCLGTRYRF